MENTHTRMHPQATSTATTVVAEAKEKEREEERVLTLHLTEAKSITWADGTVDNEHMGKKSSKRCCIYHKPKAFGESDSEESDSDTEKAKKDTERKEEKIKNYQRFHA
eukprot:gene2702-2878_t